MDFLLDPEQERALEFLVEVTRRVSERVPIWGREPMGTNNVILAHPGVPPGHPGLYPGDIETLAEGGFLRVQRPDRGNWRIDVTPLGFQQYASIKSRQGAGLKAIEVEPRSYIDGDSFRARHAEALGKWRQAEELLWSADHDNQLTTIGHLCREAMQAFATSLLKHRPVAGAPPDPTKTIARIKAVVAIVSSSGSVTAVIDALVVYWGAVSDLVQRQEHGGQKEGEPLHWEDARRLVFHTLFTMVELDRAVT
jgi:hypothetical protein